MPIDKEIFHYAETSWAIRCQGMRGVDPNTILNHTTDIPIS